MELDIEYIDSTGSVSTRRISNILPTNLNTILAHCHLRNEDRTFTIINIRQAVDLETGEVIDNLWKFLGQDKEGSGQPRIIFLVAPVLPAIQALKYFCLQVRRKRGFSKQERQPIIDFINRQARIPDELQESLDEWLKKIWCGDDREADDPLYFDSLSRVSGDLLRDCRNTSLIIARGSGRCAIPADIEARIDREFPIPRG